MPGCLFCAIVAGTVPAFKVVDSTDGVGFLDIRPVFKGHVLVVPRTHVSQLTELLEPSGCPDSSPWCSGWRRRCRRSSARRARSWR
nr:hypothetical protein GCM10020092_097440 [Actinoplanes digitatis]